MKNKPTHLYEYSIVRIVPDLARGECLNVGLIMMCKKQRWVKVRFGVDASRILAVAPGFDIRELTNQLQSFQRIAEQDTALGGDISALDAHERFRWLTAVRSATIQTSAPHCGLSDDLDGTFDRLFAQLVL